MKFPEIKSALEHLIKTTSCAQCKSKYKVDNIHIIASTKTEGLFEIHCPSCDSANIVSVFLAPIKNGEKISKNDILDVKNFLSGFDGNFKKLFTKD